MGLPNAIAIDSGTVLVAIPLIVLPIAAIAFAMSGPAWRSIGKGPFAIEQELPPPRPSSANQVRQPFDGEFDPRNQSGPEGRDRHMQEVEARQMLEAKAYRQRRRGEAEIDVEAEVARALAIEAAPPPARHAELEAEIRQLVVARNERRLRQGKEPLDVEAETRRQLDDLVGSP